MNYDNSYKLAFGNSLKGKLISGLEVGMLVAAFIALILFLLTIIFPHNHFNELPSNVKLIFFTAFFFMGFYIGASGVAYPFSVRFFKPNKKRIGKYRLKLLEEIEELTDKDQRIKIQINEKNFRIAKLDIELNKL